MLVIYDTNQIKDNLLSGDLLITHNPIGCFLVSINSDDEFELIALDDIDPVTGGLKRFKLNFIDLQVFIANRQCKHMSRQDFQLKIMRRG